jgi:hypothetical protein
MKHKRVDVRASMSMLEGSDSAMFGGAMMAHAGK